MKVAGTGTNDLMVEQDIQAIGKQRQTSPVSRTNRIKRLIWAGVEGTLYRCSFHTWSGWRAMLLRMFGAKIGQACTIRRTSRVYYPWLFEMGDMSSLGDRTEVYNLGQVTLGKRVTLSQECYLCAGTHDYLQPTMPLVTRPIVIGDDAWICVRALVYPGVTVGRGGIVAAGAVAVKNVENWTIVGGNPAKLIKSRPVLEI